MSGDLAAFLTARLDEDEAAATPGRRALDDLRFELKRGDAYEQHLSSQIEDGLDAQTAAWQARVLRDVAAKRAILELHKVYSEPTRWGISHSDPAMRGKPTGGTTYWCEICDYDRDYGHIGSDVEGCDTLRHLAEVYRDNPDYRQEWAP